MAQRMACTLTFRLYTAILYSINRVVKNISESLPALRSTKVLDQLRERIRYLHYSIRTEQAYVYWVRAYIRFHGIRHPATMAGPEVEQFLGWLVSARNVSASTHRQALSALLLAAEESDEPDVVASAVGHADTAAVFGAALGVPVACRRISVTLRAGERAILGQYNGPRLPEGATALPDGASIRWLLVEVAA